MANKIAKSRADKIAEFRKLNKRWELMPRLTANQITASNAVCTRLNNMFKELFPKEYQEAKAKQDGSNI